MRRALAAALLCSLVALSGCKSVSAAKPARYIVLVVDRTGSARVDKGYYAELADRIMKRARWGDRVVLLDITGHSLSDSSIVTDTVLADESVDSQLERTSADGNQLVQRAAERLREERLAVLRRRIVEEVRRSLSVTVQKGSDQLAAAEVAARCFEGAKGPKKLIFLTDGLIEDGDHGFATHAVGEAQAKAIIAQQKDSLPKLAGVDVLCCGATAPSDKRMREVAAFWTAYFTATEAHMKPSWYGRQLPESVLADFMG